MRHRKLGKDGPEITTVGFGAWAVGGPWEFGWGPQEDDDSITAIRHALDSGINWVDTAAAYGLGHSEEVVGRALDGYQAGSEVFVFTKCGLNWYGSEDNSVQNDLRPESVRFECEQSLKRLNVERIDLYQFHWPDEMGTPVEDSWGTMAELIEEGKVRWGGVSNFDVDLLERCEAIRHVDSLQPPLNMIDRGSASDVIPWSKDNGTGVIVYSPMASGLLTGKYDASKIAELPDDDWRKEEWSGEELEANLALVDELRSIASGIGATLPELAVAWATHVDGVTAAIVGARSADQVDGWIRAADLDLDESTMRSLTEAINTTGAGNE